MDVRLEWYGDKITHDVERAGLQGLKKAAAVLQGEARKVVPHDEGVLESSIVISNAFLETEHISIVGTNSEYAIVQHENLGFRHAPGRKAKYLEDPLTENADRLVSVVAKEISGVFND